MGPLPRKAGIGFPINEAVSILADPTV